MVRNFLKNLIKAYQKIISPDTGILRIFFPFGACRYYPTCSEYGKQSIEERGVIKGTVLLLYRIVRCNPLSKGGYDPIIKKQK